MIENYDGENLAEFRQNLIEIGVVKVSSTPDCKGGVSTLRIEVNAENYQAILKLLKKAIIENGRGYDSKADAMTNDPNEMNIQSMYSEIDLDSNEMQEEFQKSFEHLMYFVNMYFKNKGMRSFEDVPMKFLFNRNIMINESSIVENCKNSEGVISNASIRRKHPYVYNSAKDAEEKRKERMEEIEYQVELARRLKELDLSNRNETEVEA